MLGEGGTGKSQVVKALRYLLEKRRLLHRLRIAAPTGLAALSIGGATLHHTFKLPRIRTLLQKVSASNRFNPDSANFSFTEQERHFLQIELSAVELIIIDEVSMMDSLTLHDIHVALKFAKCELSLPFGGASVLFCGDFLQFAPVSGSALYKMPTLKPSPTAFQRQRHFHAQMGHQLFQDLTGCTVLKEQMRQRHDLPYTQLLARLRQENGCTPQDYQLLKTRIGATVPADTNYLVSRHSLASIINARDLRAQANANPHMPIYVFDALDVEKKQTVAGRNGFLSLIIRDTCPKILGAANKSQ